jgi:succinoglycan biosynthesis protein ExoM
MIAIGICICTYKRQEKLKSLLLLLNSYFKDSIDFDLRIIVVDNDPQYSAENVLRELKAQSQIPLTYYNETRRGISHARNRALKESGDVEFVAFLDDDEIPSKVWLRELIKIQRKYNSYVVIGPVVYCLDRLTKPWILNYFNRKKQISNNIVDTLNTGNILIKKIIFKNNLEPFDIDFGLSGGEDTILGYYLKDQGYIFNWSENAVVYEHIPVNRTSIRWILMRTYGKANVFSRILIKMNNDYKVIVRRIIISIAKTALGIILVVPCFFLLKKQKMLGLLMFMFGIGGLTGLLGIKYYGYK